MTVVDCVRIGQGEKWHVVAGVTDGFVEVVCGLGARVSVETINAEDPNLCRRCLGMIGL